MKDLFELVGITRQAYSQHLQRISERDQVHELVIDKILKVRERHKRMSCRRIYYTCAKDVPVGRDRFERIGHGAGFLVRKRRNPHKTTWSQRVDVQPNLTGGRVVNGINQVWQSDIFHLPVSGKNFYGVTIMDVYARKLLALHLSKSLEAAETVKAIEQAFDARKGQSVKGCIFHSDRGVQYISDMLKQKIKENNMVISHCKMPQQNAYVERIQGTLKNEYLFEHPITEKNLTEMATKIKQWYNVERPHSKLHMKTPDFFEQDVQKLPGNKRPKLLIFDYQDRFSTNQLVVNKTEKSTKKEKSQR